MESALALPPPMQPHLVIRPQYMPDPSTSCWRIDIFSKFEGPSPLHPEGRRKSSGSPWPEDPWILSDQQRQDKAAREWNFHELWIEKRPLTPDGLLPIGVLRRSESEVEAMQKKERILEGRDETWPLKEVAGDVEEVKKAQRLKRGRVRFDRSADSSVDLSRNGRGRQRRSAYSVTDASMQRQLERYPGDRTKRDDKAKEDLLQFQLDLAATILMLVGLAAIYLAVTGTL